MKYLVLAAVVTSMKSRNLDWFQSSNHICLWVQGNICREYFVSWLIQMVVCRDHGLWVPSKSVAWNFEALHYSRRCPFSILLKGEPVSLLNMHWSFMSGQLKLHEWTTEVPFLVCAQNVLWNRCIVAKVSSYVRNISPTWHSRVCHGCEAAQVLFKFCPIEFCSSR